MVIKNNETNKAVEPKHYLQFKITPLDVIEEWGLGFSLGNVVKYVARAKHKGNYLQDLKKAKKYLELEIDRAEGKR